VILVIFNPTVELMSFFSVCCVCCCVITSSNTLIGDARGHEQITRSSDLRDVDWKTWTCILGWPVQGIWQKEAKGTDVNAADRHVHGHSDYRLFLTSSSGHTWEIF
jgi:hypothetical protein